jgi:Zn-dependent protease
MYQKMKEWFTILPSMPPAIQFANPIRFDRLTRVVRIRGVDVFVHWTVFLIAGIMIYASFRKPWLTLTGGASWMALILLHECGHMIAAHRRHTHVFAIELYPIHGLCCYEMPWSKFDRCVIAWGGVIAQAAVAIPFLLWIEVFGYTHWDPIDAVLGILGPYSLLVAAFNLLPVGRLDGRIAWGIIPEFIRKKKQGKKKKAAAASDWRSY